MRAFHARIGAPILLVVALAWAAPAAAQAEGEAAGRSTIGGTFFRGPDASAAQRAEAHRWGVPRLESLRGDHRTGTEGSTVPINVGSLANGTANTPVPHRPRTRRPTLPRILPTGYVQVNNRIDVVIPPAAGRRRGAIRNVDAARARSEEEASRPARPAPSGSPPLASPEPAPRTGVSSAPLVEPLVAPPRDRELDARDCVTLRITTPGGIEWRHEVGLDVLGATSVTGAASLLQEKLRLGEPLSVRSDEGGFTVPARLVESLIVGPCR